MQLTTHTFDLPLKHEFRISREAHTVQPTFIVELSDGAVRGYGEATTNTYYGMTLEKMTAAVEQVRPILEGFELGEPAELYELVAAEILADCPFAVCAIDQAAYDLWGKRHGRPVYDLWGLSIDDVPVSNYTIGIDTIETMVAKLEEEPDWPIYKIKLGTPEDLDIVRQLRQHTRAVFRVDANCGWTAEETLGNARALKELNVEFIEQPLPADQRDAMRRVYRRVGLPLIADESCITESDVAKCDGLVSRNQHQAREVRRADTSPADDRRGTPAGAQGDGRLHDRIDGRHLGDRAAVAPARLRRYGRGGAPGRRHRERRSCRERRLSLPRRPRLGRRAAGTLGRWDAGTLGLFNLDDGSRER